jgi:tyrosine-protein phosphatase SIW14
MSFFNRPTIALFICSLPVFAGSAPGINNFDQVDQRVYRGGQPSAEGLQYLAKIGVKNILDLREADKRGIEEERMVKAAGMRYINVPMTGLTPPTEAEINKILALLKDESAGPVFVHCKRGADRTGAVIAAYHIDHDRWDNSRALKDAMSHGMSHFQFPRQGFIRQFQARTIDAGTKPAVDTASVTPAVAPLPKN